MTQPNDKKSPYIDFIINFVKSEILQDDFKEEIIRPLLIYMLYYVIPIVIIIIILNFVATITGVMLVLYFNKSFHAPSH